MSRLIRFLFLATGVVIKSHATGKGSAHGRGGVKDMPINGLEDFPDRQTYRGWERAEQLKCCLKPFFCTCKLYVLYINDIYNKYLHI